MQNKSLYSDLGLTEKQALIYDLLISKGSQTIAELSKTTKIHRGIVFFITKELIQKGVVEKTKSPTGKDVYLSTHPDNLLKIFEKRQAELEQSKKQFEAELPALITNYSLVTSKPGVVYFEGPLEFQKIHDDIISVGQEYKNLFSTFSDYEKYLKHTNTTGFQEQRQKQKIKLKILLKANEARLSEYFEADPLTQIRFIPEEKLVFPSQVIIYGSKVALLSFNPTLSATVIENNDINQTFNQIFDYIWETTKSHHDRLIEQHRPKV